MDSYRRVTVLAPASRVDVALPADLPVAELAPMVLELLGTPAPERAPAPWRLDGAAGAPLPPSATLAQLGVLDGDLLRIGPELPAPLPPRFDEAPDALAAAVEAASRRPRAALPAAILVAVTIASLLLAGLRGVGILIGAGAVGVGLVGAAVVMVVLARAGSGSRVGAASGAGAGYAADADSGAHEAGPTDPPRTLLALTAIPPAAAAGWIAVPGPPTAAVLGATLLAALAAWTAQAVLRTAAPALLAVLLVTATSAIAAATLLLTGAPPATAGAACALAAGLAAPLLPRAALRLARVPAPAVDDLRAPLPDEPDPPADLARAHLAGLVVGTAVVAAGGAALAATRPGWAGPVLAAVVGAILLLRARSFAEPVPAGALQVTGVLAVVGAAAPAALTATPLVRFAIAAGLLAVLLIAVAVPRAEVGPVGRRMVDLGELGLTALAVPLAVFALDLFALVRGW